MKRDMHYKGRIYIGCEKDMPTEDFYMPKETFSRKDQDAYWFSVRRFEEYIKKLQSSPYSGPSLKDGQEVVFGIDYELRHRYFVEGIRGERQAEWISASKEHCEQYYPNNYETTAFSLGIKKPDEGGRKDGLLPKSECPHDHDDLEYVGNRGPIEREYYCKGCGENVTTSVLKAAKEKVDSIEQIDNVPMDFVVWHSGMERHKIKRAYLRWVRETYPEMPVFPTPNS
jgi:hypothetical protein